MGRLNHKRGRKSNYLVSLNNNEYHREVKRKAALRDRFSCVDCGSRLFLEVHHLNYKYVGAELDHLDCVVTLCEKCHAKRHGR